MLPRKYIEHQRVWLGSHLRSLYPAKGVILAIDGYVPPRYEVEVKGLHGADVALLSLGEGDVTPEGDFEIWSGDTTVPGSVIDRVALSALPDRDEYYPSVKAEVIVELSAESDSDFRAVDSVWFGEADCAKFLAELDALKRGIEIKARLVSMSPGEFDLHVERGKSEPIVRVLLRRLLNRRTEEEQPRISGMFQASNSIEEIIDGFEMFVQRGGLRV